MLFPMSLILHMAWLVCWLSASVVPARVVLPQRHQFFPALLLDFPFVWAATGGLCDPRRYFYAGRDFAGLSGVGHRYWRQPDGAQ